MATLPHTPSYDSKSVRPQRTLKKRMEDGSVQARVKSDPLWELELVYKSRPIDEFLNIEEFYETYGEVIPFQYTHFLDGITYDVVFESPPEVTQGSFDSVDFMFKVVEWTGGSIVLPTISSLPTDLLRVDYDFHNFSGLNNDPINTLSNAAPNYTSEQLFLQYSGGVGYIDAPIFKTAQINGRGVARFDGVETGLETVDDITVSDFTFYAVWKDTTETAGTVFDLGGSTFAKNYGSEQYQFQGEYGTSYVYPDSQWNIAYGGRLSDTYYVFADGATVATRSIGDTEITGQLAVGSFHNAVSPLDGFLEGDIARIIIYEGFLNKLKRHQIYNYLKDDVYNL